MLSIFSSLKLSDLKKRCELLSRVTSLLLEGIRLHTVPGKPETDAQFRNAMQHHDLEFETAAPERLLTVTGAVLQTMSDHARKTTGWHSSGRRELQGMVVLLTKSMTQTLHRGQRASTSLQAITTDIEKVTKIEDLQSVRGRLESCLNNLQEETKRLSEEQAALRTVMQQVSTAPTVAESFASAGEDPVTGLSTRPQAEQLLSEALQERRPVYAVPLRLCSLVMINNRYGRLAGDEYFLKVAQLIAQKLGAEDKLFRWDGPALLAILQRKQAVGIVRSEVARFTTSVAEQVLTLEGRALLLRVGLSSLCLDLGQFPELTGLVAHIDSFSFGNYHQRGNSTQPT